MQMTASVNKHYFHSEEVETEVVQLGGKPIADCLQCNVCQKTGKCVIKNDGVNEFVEKAKTADGFVFATPVYFAHPSGRIYDFLDRVFYSAGGYDTFKYKPGAAIAVARRGGTDDWHLRNPKIFIDSIKHCCGSSSSCYCNSRLSSM